MPALHKSKLDTKADYNTNSDQLKATSTLEPNQQQQTWIPLPTWASPLKMESLEGQLIHSFIWG